MSYLTTLKIDQFFFIILGSNKYCLDVNYGGVLIIWDRLFGTFRPETDKIEIVYGLIYNQPSFNPLYLQVFIYFIHIIMYSKKHELMILPEALASYERIQNNNIMQIQDSVYQNTHNTFNPLFKTIQSTIHTQHIF